MIELSKEDKNKIDDFLKEKLGEQNYQEFKKLVADIYKPYYEYEIRRLEQDIAMSKSTPPKLRCEL